MFGPVFIITIVAICCATVLIKTWIEKRDTGSASDEQFGRLARAFMEHKKDMEQRIRNLEAIIAEENEEEFYPQMDEHESEERLTNDLQQKKRERL